MITWLAIIPQIIQLLFFSLNTYPLMAITIDLIIIDMVDFFYKLYPKNHRLIGAIGCCFSLIWLFYVYYVKIMLGDNFIGAKSLIEYTTAYYLTLLSFFFYGHKTALMTDNPIIWFIFASWGSLSYSLSVLVGSLLVGNVNRL